MAESDWLAEGFERNRTRLRAVAYRMLGSFAEADDAVQETWLRLSRSDAGGVDNLSAWLTTIVARVCLNVLRERSTFRHTRATIVVSQALRLSTPLASDRLRRSQASWTASRTSAAG